MHTQEVSLWLCVGYLFPHIYGVEVVVFVNFFFFGFCLFSHINFVLAWQF